MKAYNKLQPPLLWQIFADICAIPHTSGHETHLRNWIAAQAAARGLPVCTDPVGNLRIDRPAAPGFENAPTIILQGHLDMVPQKAPEVEFDFITEPIQLRLKGDRLYANGTTLGADDGIGIAAALSLLFDPDFHCGPLALLATVQEETGLDGAREIQPHMLTGDLLLNLDSEEEGVFYLGCAGGESAMFRFLTAYEPLPGKYTGFKLRLGGLKGGHSGADIDLNHGNAVMLLVDFLQKNPDCRVASINGGSVDNVIPDEATAEIAVPVDNVEFLTAAAGDFVRQIREKFDVTPQCDLTLTPSPPPAIVWKTAFQRKALTAIHQLPDGVLDAGPIGGPVVTSNNVAILRARLREVELVIHPRSIADAHSRVTGRCRELLAPLAPEVTVTGSYPSWQPQYDSPALKTAEELYREFSGKPARHMVIHAGLECGLFKRLRPDLEMLSFGPEVCQVHTANEYVETASVTRFDRFLRDFLIRLAGRNTAPKK